MARKLTSGTVARPIEIGSPFGGFMSLIFLAVLILNFVWPAGKILGISQSKEREKIQKEILLWQKTVDEFPGYRDAYIKLAILNWKLNRNFVAQKLLNQALEIDPNSEAVSQFSKVLK